MGHSGDRGRSDGRAGMTTFGAELRQRRAAAGLSLRQLAARIHYSVGYLSKVEQDSKRPSEALARLCDAEVGAGGALIALVTPGDSPAGGQGGGPLDAGA